LTTDLKDVTYKPVLKIALAVADRLGLNSKILMDNAKIKIWDDNNFKVEPTGPGHMIKFYFVSVSDDNQKLTIQADNSAPFTMDNPIK
jgi:hypothetical protein